jgi:hypothetical protein
MPDVAPAPLPAPHGHAPALNSTTRGCQRPIEILTTVSRYKYCPRILRMSLVAHFVTSRFAWPLLYVSINYRSLETCFLFMYALRTDPEVNVWNQGRGSNMINIIT